MDNKLALTTAITLAHREAAVGDEDGVSVDLIRDLLNLVKVSDVNIGTGTDGNSVANVKATIIDICRQAEVAVYTPDDLLTRIRLNISDDEKWYTAIERSINSKLDELAIAKSIFVLRNKVKAFINQEKIANILREKTSTWNFRHESIPDTTKFIQDICAELEETVSMAGTRDTAIQDEVDFDKIETVKAVAEKVAAIENGTLIWKTGWQDFNDMFQGGLREGETHACGALPHNDKTGTTLSIFKQLAVYNEPRIRKTGKKPTLVRLTFEDPMTNNMNYLYQNIVHNQTGELVETKGVPPGEIADVVAKELTSRGFSIRMAYVDPSDWSYRSLQNYVLRLEAEGHDVQVLMVDYLSMIPTTGCRQGATGTDLQDLFRRMRNFCRSRGILFITPHQLSTEALNLTRGLVSDETFLPFIALKGYWQDAKGLAREFDGAFYVHLIKKDGETYKAFQRDKHRWPGILEESKKFFILKYPGPMPIPDDIGKERLGIRKIGRPVSNTQSNTFF